MKISSQMDNIRDLEISDQTARMLSKCAGKRGISETDLLKLIYAMYGTLTERKIKEYLWNTY